ncbi:hypothetical protein [Metabacillus sp. FJAT-52054]|uniref:Uncharacterized protein n=1 Tax=Metabacillus sediminis TaxID=3117746 RepID=A0ABZ2NDL5_9BACI
MNGIESIINAIADNPIVSAALIWVVGAIFSRTFRSGDKKTENQKKPKERPESFKVQEKQLQESVQTVYERVQREINKEKIKNNRGYEKELSVVKLNRASNHQKKAALQNPAAQGIIWAEIIGKPRSLNPHHTRRSK